MVSMPSISVIVRTTGRPLLERALACVVAQTHRPLEIVLADSLLTQEPRESSGDVPVRLIQRGRMYRAQAANAGLDAARGDLVAFLDEDDEIDPGHLGDLVAALQAERGTRAAYSQTRLVSAGGETERLLGGPFNRMRLFMSNYLGIHAVLFERSLVVEGCRFDESLPIFEDWDFWLQLSMRTAFAFTGKPTAIYHTAAGDSGAGAGTNLNRAAVLAQRERLTRKWANARRALEIASGLP
jgi:glycosyltransferase involved in cell wall biosynthesis